MPYPSDATDAPTTPATAREATIRVFVVDDHPVVRRGLAMLVDGEPDMTTCGTAGDIREACAGVDKAGPDVLLVDLSLGDDNGLELLARVSRGWVGVRMLVVSQHEASIYAPHAAKLGAMGFINKDADPERIFEAIRSVHAGEPAFPPDVDVGDVDEPFS